MLQLSEGIWESKNSSRQRTSGRWLSMKFHHFRTMAGRPLFLRSEFVEAANIPGHDAQRAGSFSGGEAVTGMQGKEVVDIGPADDKGGQRKQGPASPAGYEKTNGKETDKQEKQQRKDQTQQRDDPPSAGMQKGIGTGQQEEDDRDDVQDNEQAAGDISQDRHGLPKLQIFFICGPFQYLFFLIGKKAVALLIDLVEDLVYTLLCYVRYLLEGLGAGYFVIEFVFGRTSPFFAVGIEKIVTPVEELVDPDAAVMSPSHSVDEEEPGCGTRKIGNIGTGVATAHSGKIDQEDRVPSGSITGYRH